MTIDKVYQPLALEKKWYQIWETSGYFSPQRANQTYCIMLPPPNVTGTLHMGHAFQDTLMDTLIRYHRMKGHQTLWQGGTDHAGIATQMVVERQLQQEGKSRTDLGREAFVTKVWEWKAQSGHTISQQMRRLGASIDWQRDRFTMDEGLSEAVREVFIQLYDEGLIYRGQRLVNWDPKLHTAVSDLEVITEEEKGFLWYLRYPIVDHPNEFLVVATTRPETMLGDVAVAVDPNDPRYQSLIGKQVHLPLCDRLIPIIADDYVEAEFGTGCVKITPAHDFNDYEVGKRHGLPMINIFTPDANLNANVPPLYQGLNRFVAREKIIKALEEANLLEKIEPYLLKVPRGDRSGEIIEPYLTDQWFVNTKPLAQAATDVVKNEKIKFIPENWSKVYFEWMDHIQDWCISRQLWWGHRIPAWYDKEGHVYVGQSEEAVKQKYRLPSTLTLSQDEDVLDTWFSSALWPFSTLGWPQQTEELNQYYPTDVLVTGFDIIFFWVARMVMMGLKFMKKIPFKHVYVTGLILDQDGQKMSKSKGNILDPIDFIDGINLDDLIKKRTRGLMQPTMAKQIERNTRSHFPKGIPSFGTDALRFNFCAIATSARFIRFDMGRLEGYRNFCNKLWNASRYVLMNLEGKETKDQEKTYSLFDRAMVSLWQKTKKEIEMHLAEYRFDMVAQTIYDFTWNQYCDWYLELSKPILTLETSSPSEQNGTRFTLITLLEEILRVLHPMMPFITEEIWQKLVPILGSDFFQNTQSIMIQSYPEYQKDKIDLNAEKELNLIQEIIMGIRTIRGEMNISPNKLVPVLYKITTAEKVKEQQIQNTFENNVTIISTIAKVNGISKIENPPFSATHIICIPQEYTLELFVPLNEIPDFNVLEEKNRIEKELEKHQKDLQYYTQKQNNPHYNKVPEAIQAKEKALIEKAEIAVNKLNNNLKLLQSFTENQLQKK